MKIEVRKSCTKSCKFTKNHCVVLSSMCSWL